MLFARSGLDGQMRPFYEVNARPRMLDSSCAPRRRWHLRAGLPTLHAARVVGTTVDIAPV
eukprot:366229-Chlamydomonas_euryale.AAC.1